jgi:hypothetical protein
MQLTLREVNYDDGNGFIWLIIESFRVFFFKITGSVTNSKAVLFSGTAIYCVIS